MASIIREFQVAAPADVVWRAFEDFQAVHRRVAPGFLTDLKEEGDVRLLTFSNGLVARERKVASDARAKRLSYAVIGERAEHHNASFQVFADGATCRVIWITDVLPDALADPVGGMMDMAIPIMQHTLAAQIA